MRHESYKISLVVMESICGKTARNMERICAYMEQAGREGARLVVFPELSLTSYCLEHAADAALPLSHPYIDVLQEAAQKAGITALVGMVEAGDTTCYISQLVCGMDGSLQVYRKTHLGEREKSVFSAGDNIPVFQAEWPLGIGICYDMHYPELAATVRQRGAELIASPHASPGKAGRREDVWAKYMPARAYDERVYVACCNACGSNGCGTEFAGGMAVYAPNGSVAAADFSGKEAMMTLELSSVSFEGAKDFPMHRRPELYI